MAQQFGEYSPAVPLGLTWEDPMVLTDENDEPVDLTGYAVHAQLHAQLPVRDPATGLPRVAPLLEITTPGAYAVAPSWPVVEAFSVAAPLTGAISLTLPRADTWTLSPKNLRAKLLWDIRLVRTADGYAIPVVQGKVTVLPARTVLA